MGYLSECGGLCNNDIPIYLRDSDVRLCALSLFLQYQSYTNGKINVGWYAVILMVTSIFYFIPSLFLYQFGVRIKRGIDIAGQDLITQGLRSLKSFFRYWGIITIIIITFYVIVFVVAILGGIGLASLGQGA